MKTLRLLNKKNFSFIITLFFSLSVQSDEKPIDIWNIEKNQNEKTSITPEIVESQNTEENNISKSNIYNMQSSKKKDDTIKLDENLASNNINIFGLFDPKDYDLDINMWANTNGDQLKNIFSRLNKINLSEDASQILNIVLLTNAYTPNKDISEEEFLKFKSDWLIKSSDLNLIEEYLIKNQIFDLHIDLVKYLVNQHLSLSDIDKSCEILSKNLKPIDDDYLTKFQIYCLIKNDKKEQAQLILDLKKELGFKDEYFENKINFLQGYVSDRNNEISDKSILDLHLAHQTNENFNFEPNDNTKKIIWKYLSNSNLLNSFMEVDISEIEKISTLEKAVHNKNYPEKNLFEIYKRFQFNINQLLNAQTFYKSLPDIEARALLYQRVLLESDIALKLKLLKTLKKLFKDDNLDNAFDVELKKFLNKMDPENIPANLTSFYYTNIKISKDNEKKIKFNNDVLHQSKLINYFNGDYSKSKIEKDLENYLKKIKKDKKYFFSKKDQIFLESLKYDGIEISKKYNDLYKVDINEIPSDIQVMINNNEKGIALLRIVEVIGQDKLERMDEDTVYFIITTLNQLDIDLLRNNILLKVLPLKV